MVRANGNTGNGRKTGGIKMGWRCKPALTDNILLNILSAKVCEVKCGILFYLKIECRSMDTINGHQTEVVYNGFSMLAKITIH